MSVTTLRRLLAAGLAVVVGGAGLVLVSSPAASAAVSRQTACIRVTSGGGSGFVGGLDGYGLTTLVGTTDEAAKFELAVGTRQELFFHNTSSPLGFVQGNFGAELRGGSAAYVWATRTGHTDPGSGPVSVPTGWVGQTRPAESSVWNVGADESLSATWINPNGQQASAAVYVDGGRLMMTGDPTAYYQTDFREIHRATLTWQQCPMEEQTLSFRITPTNVRPGDVRNVYAEGGTSSKPTVYSSGSPDYCQVNGQAVTFLKPGTCVVLADRAGDGSHEPAPTARLAIPIGKWLQTVEFTSDPPAGAVNQGSADLSARGGASGQPVVFSAAADGICSVTGSTVSFLKAGTCTVYADQDGTAEYEPAARASQSFAVGRAAQVVTFQGTPPTDAAVFGSTVVTATGGGSGNQVVFSSTTPLRCSVDGTTVSFRRPGPCVVQADQQGDGDYRDALPVTRTIDVAPAAQAVTFTSDVPDGALPKGTTTVAARGGGSTSPVVFSSGSPGVCRVKGAKVTYIKNGVCVVLADQAGDDLYAAAPQARQEIQVGRRVQTIVFTSTPPAPATVGADYPVTTTGGGSGNPVVLTTNAAVCTVAGSTVHFVRTGTCVVSANQDGNGRYLGAKQAQQRIKVVKPPKGSARH